MERFSPVAPKAPRAPGSKADAPERILAFARSFRETRMQILVAIGALSTFALYATVIYPIETYGRGGSPRIERPTTPTTTAAPLVDAGAAALLPAVDAGEDASDAGAAPAEPIFRVADLKKDPTVTVVEGTVGKRPLLTALAAAGILHPDTRRILKAFDGVHDLDHARPKDTFVFAKEKQGGKLVAFEYATSVSDVWQAREAEGGVLEAKKLDLPVEQRRVALGLSVGSDLRESLVKAGLDDDMMGLLDDALEGRVELAEIHPGTRMRLLATEERVSGEFVRYSELDALEYVPADPHLEPVRVYRLPREGSHAFYDAKGQQPTRGGWRKPVPLARIASRFNPHRMHPVLHVVMPHNGVDFAAPPGTPVYAAAAGVVKTVGDLGPGGNTVLITHAATGLTSGYCHLSRFASGIHVGTKVDVRQLIGYVGATGRVTGPHLHFSIKRGDVFIDPLSLKLDGVRVVPPSEREPFDASRAKLDAELDAVALPPPPEGWSADAGPRAPQEEEKEENFDDLPAAGHAEAGAL